jgi:hypothetical protein
MDRVFTKLASISDSALLFTILEGGMSRDNIFQTIAGSLNVAPMALPAIKLCANRSRLLLSPILLVY